MQTLSVRDAKYGFRRLMDLPRARPVAVSEHAGDAVVALSIEKYDRLKTPDPAIACEMEAAA